MEVAVVDTPALTVRRLCCFDPENRCEFDVKDYIFDAPGVEELAAGCAGIILREGAGSEARAATLLTAGAPLVFLGEGALFDGELVRRMAQSYPGRIGIYALAQRQAVSWTLDTVSNADFRTVTPSVGEPAWEVLKANGAPTGTLLGWWLAAMRERGATQFLVHVDVRDDTDLNILAGLVETFGEGLWVGPRSDEGCLPFEEWINYGHCRQLVLSASIYERHQDSAP
ncbi:MAG: hypothetical protein ACK4N6_01055 [Rhodocyclaceae bacterium]